MLPMTAFSSPKSRKVLRSFLGACGRLADDAIP